MNYIYSEIESLIRTGQSFVVYNSQDCHVAYITAFLERYTDYRVVCMRGDYSQLKTLRSDIKSGCPLAGICFGPSRVKLADVLHYLTYISQLPNVLVVVVANVSDHELIDMVYNIQRSSVTNLLDILNVVDVSEEIL